MVTASRESPKTRDGASGSAQRRPTAAPPNPAWTGLALGARASPVVSHPGDPSEREAEQLADQITQSALDGLVQRRAGGGVRVSPSGSGTGATAALGAGAALDAPTRRWFEPRLGADLSAVRVHTDATAGRAAGDINAHAFTTGSHIAFADGQYSPGTGQGRHLIAHELVHVLQGGHAIRRSAVSPGDVTPGERQGEGPERRQYVPASTPKVPPVPSPETCPPPKNMTCPPATSPAGAVTNTLLFGQDSSALTTLQRDDIDTAAASWHTAGGSAMVRIDGFASAEGQCEYNWNLSCRRAQAVQNEIEHPHDGSPGVPGGNVEIFAHGESDEAGRALAPNRRATISLPVPPPPPPPPAPVIPTCAFPVLLGTGRTGCGVGTDFGHFDYPPNTLPTASAAKLAAWAAAHGRGPFRSLVTGIECEAEMDGVLVGLAGSTGHAAFTQFVSGAGGTVTHGGASTLGSMALISGSFLATVAAVKTNIESQLAAQAPTGVLNPCGLAVTPPATAFSFSDGAELKAVIGGTHGEKLFADSFTGSAVARTYTIDLHFLICDNFGVDEADLYAPGLFGFWVLQHERSPSAYAPFINELDLTVTVGGTF